MKHAREGATVRATFAALTVKAPGALDDASFLESVMAADDVQVKQIRRRRVTLHSAFALAAALLLAFAVTKIGRSVGTARNDKTGDAASMSASPRAGSGRAHERLPAIPRAQAPSSRRAVQPEPAPEHETAPEHEHEPSTPPPAAAPVHRRQAVERESTRRPAAPSPTMLLKRAQMHVAAGELELAESVYTRITAGHPAHRTAGLARLALGNIALGRGHAKAALQYFDAYLQRAGALADEARYGRVRALRLLGDREAELTAVEAFVGVAPNSTYAPAMRRRASALSAQ